MDKVIIQACENIAARVAEIEERALDELMRRSGFDHYSVMQEKGYRAVREQHGNGDVHWVLCKDVDRQRVPKITVTSSRA